MLLDTRRAPVSVTLAGALAWPGPDFAPPPGTPADAPWVLFDDDGSATVPLARAAQAAGHPQARALFGGLALYAFALDPQVVGEETFLRGGERPA